MNNMFLNLESLSVLLCEKQKLQNFDLLTPGFYNIDSMKIFLSILKASFEMFFNTVKYEI